MSDYIIAIHSADALTPRAAEVIRTIVDESFKGSSISFTTDLNAATQKKLLCFGKSPDMIKDGWEHVETYSIAQLMTKPNAATVLSAAIERVIGGFIEPPFQRPVATVDADVLLGRLALDEPIAIDIETDGNLGSEHTPDEVNIISVAVWQEGMAYPRVIVNPDPENNQSRPLNNWQLDGLRVFLPNFTKAVYHNGKFDTRVLNRVLGVKLDVWFDTMLAHHVLNIAAGMHGLKALAQRYLGAPEWEAGLRKYLKGGGHYELIPYDKLVAYNGWDVFWTLELYKFLAPQIANDADNEKAFALEMSAASFLLDVENYGIPFDDNYAVQLTNACANQMALLNASMRVITGDLSFNPNSPQQIKKWLLSQQVMVKSTDEETITQLKEVSSGVVRSFCEALLAYRKESKISSTYANGWRKQARNGRIHPTFLVHGTSTGRLSSTQPNVQNLPRDKRVRGIVSTHG